jgi:hypothetical protein
MNRALFLSVTVVIIISAVCNAQTQYNTDIQSIARALVEQAPDINGEWKFKRLDEYELKTAQKHYLHYFSEKTEDAGKTVLQMYWYERPAAANDFGLVSYDDGSLEGFHPWLKCFSYGRKTGNLTETDLPFELPTADKFDEKLFGEDQGYWRVNYAIADNGNIMISASPAMASICDMIVRWDNKAGFTVFKRHLYSMFEDEPDDTDMEKYVVNVVRPNFQRINAIKQWKWIEKKETPDLCSDNATLSYYNSENRLEKMVVNISGKSYQETIEFYLLDCRLSFIYEKSEKDAKLRERRWYFKDDNCFRGIGDNGKNLTPAEIEKEVGETEKLFYKMLKIF